MKIYYISIFFLILISCKDIKTKNNDTPKTDKNGLVENKSLKIEKIQHITFDYENSNFYILHVKDAKGKIIKIIDTRRFNPFKELEYPIDYINPDSTQFTYDLSKISNEEKEIILNQFNNSPTKVEISKAYVPAPFISVQNEVAAVSFNIEYFISDHDILGVQGVTILLNKEGQIINEIKDKNNGFRETRLSHDGNLLLQKYGFEYGEEGGMFLYMGFKYITP